MPREQVQLLINYSPDPALFETNWNALHAIAKGEYVCILGDDDTLEPDYLRACVAALDASGADIAYTDVVLRDATGRATQTYRPPRVIALDTMRAGNFLWSSSVVRWSRWAAVGGYDMGIPYVHDYDFWVRCLSDGARAEYVPMHGWNHYEHQAGRVTTTTDHAAAFAAFDAKHPGFRARRTPF